MLGKAHPNHNHRSSRAPIPPTVFSSADSDLVDVDSPHVSTVPSDFEAQSIKTDTQAERLEREEEEEEVAAKGGSEQNPGSRGKSSGSSSSKKSTAAEKAKEGKEKAKHGAKEAREKAREVTEHGKERAQGCFEKLRRNKSNPVVVGNALLIAVASGMVGYQAYERHLRGLLTWELAATWGGGLGLAASVDYFVSRYVVIVGCMKLEKWVANGSTQMATSEQVPDKISSSLDIELTRRRTTP